MAREFADASLEGSAARHVRCGAGFLSDPGRHCLMLLGLGSSVQCTGRVHQYIIETDESGFLDV